MYLHTKCLHSSKYRGKGTAICIDILSISIVVNPAGGVLAYVSTYYLYSSKSHLRGTAICINILSISIVVNPACGVLPYVSRYEAPP